MNVSRSIYFLCALSCFSCLDLTSKNRCQTNDDCISGFFCDDDRRCTQRNSVLDSETVSESNTESDSEPDSEPSSERDTDTVEDYDSESESETECKSSVVDGGTEECNNLDDDCDGTTDEDILDVCMDHDSLNQCIENSITKTSCAAKGLTCLARHGENDVCGGSCAYQQLRCGGISGKDVQICNDRGQWEPKHMCETECVVNEGIAQCMDCVNGEFRCIANNTQQTCANNQWENDHNCTEDNQTCLGKRCQGVCSPDQERCAYRQTQTCSASGQWHGSVICDDECLEIGNREAARCVQCLSGDTICRNLNYLVECGSHNTFPVTGGFDCRSINQTCVEDSCTGDCGQEQTKCADGDLGTSHQYTCTKMGEWSTLPEECTGHLCYRGKCTCHLNKCTGKCRFGTSSCNTSGKILMCDINGQWSEPVRCEVGDVCNPKTGLCENNDPFIVGRATVEDGTAVSLSDGWFIATRVYLAEKVKLREIGMVLLAPSTMGETIYGIYTDTFDEEGDPVPGAQIARTDKVEEWVSSGPGYSGPKDSLILRGRRHYWVAALIKDVTENAGRVEVAHWTGVANAQSVRTRASFSSEMPEIAPIPDEKIADTEYSLFAKVEHYYAYEYSGSPVDTCLDYAEVVAAACERCGRDYQANYEAFLKNITPAGDCSDTTFVKDVRAFYEECIPWFQASDCETNAGPSYVEESCSDQIIWK